MDCLPLEDVCNLQASYERRRDEDVIPPYVYFEDSQFYLFFVNNRYVIVKEGEK